MTRRSSAAVLRQIETLFTAGSCSGLSDRQLLARFVAHRDAVAELAFTTLVERHGSMVLGVCRRILADSHDAEDAFQATFLVLVRQAGSIRVDGSLVVCAEVGGLYDTKRDLMLIVPPFWKAAGSY